MKKLKKSLKQREIKVDEHIKKELIEELKKLGINPRTATRKAMKLIIRGAVHGKRN